MAPSLLFRNLFVVILLFLLSISLSANTPDADTSKLKITVSVVHGFKLKRQYRKEMRQFIRGFETKAVGGLKGGHVEVHINQVVYGFTDIPQDKMPHVFPRKNKSEGIFIKTNEDEWQQKFQNQKVTFIEIQVSKEQHARLLDTYEAYTENCPYDFALFGKRCASSCYEILASVGILEKKSQWGVVMGVFHPRAFRKKVLKQSKKKDFDIQVREADSTNKKWDK